MKVSRLNIFFFNLTLFVWSWRIILFDILNLNYPRNGYWSVINRESLSKSSLTLCMQGSHGEKIMSYLRLREVINCYCDLWSIMIKLDKSFCCFEFRLFFVLCVISFNSFIGLIEQNLKVLCIPFLSLKLCNFFITCRSEMCAT